MKTFAPKPTPVFQSRRHFVALGLGVSVTVIFPWSEMSLIL